MKGKILVGVILVTLVLTGGAVMAAKGGKSAGCTTIQDGGLVDTAENPISVGYDQFGYNYQSHMYNGRYCDVDRVIGGAYCDVELIMKWNDAWLANTDCDDPPDGLLDRHHGFDSYIGSGAWLTNHQWGEYDECTWDYFTKIVAVPADAYRNVAGNWEINVKYLGMDYPETLILTQSGNEITGVSLNTIPPASGSAFTIVSGSVTGNTVEIFADHVPSSLVVRLWGTIAADGSMSGNWADVAPGTRVGTWASTNGEATSIWYAADGTEIGPVIWGEFATIQSIYNDPCDGVTGVEYLSPSPTGFGYYK